MLARTSLIALVALSLTLAPTALSADDQLRIESTPADDATLDELETMLQSARSRVESFFGAPFREPVVVHLHPDRRAFTSSFPAEWGLTRTQCWMVAYGVADRLSLISPRVWNDEACEHDPSDTQHVQRIITHELVHSYHGQHNVTRDFTGIEEPVGWFAEGLAVYASGQYDDKRREQARAAVARGAVPTGLTTAWSGADRYAVCGSIAAFLDARVGRNGIIDLLAATDLDAFFARTRFTEDELLAAWKASISNDTQPEPVDGALPGVDLRDGLSDEAREVGVWSNKSGKRVERLSILRGRAVLELHESDATKSIAMSSFDAVNEDWGTWIDDGSGPAMRPDDKPAANAGLTRTAHSTELPIAGGTALTCDAGTRCTNEHLETLVGTWRGRSRTGEPVIASGWRVLDGQGVVLRMQWETDGERHERFAYVTEGSLVTMTDSDERPTRAAALPDAPNTFEIDDRRFEFTAADGEMRVVLWERSDGSWTSVRSVTLHK